MWSTARASTVVGVVASRSNYPVIPIQVLKAYIKSLFATMLHSWATFQGTPSTPLEVGCRLGLQDKKRHLCEVIYFARCLQGGWAVVIIIWVAILIKLLSVILILLVGRWKHVAVHSSVTPTASLFPPSLIVIRISSVSLFALIIIRNGRSEGTLASTENYGLNAVATAWAIDEKCQFVSMVVVTIRMTNSVSALFPIPFLNNTLTEKRKPLSILHVKRCHEILMLSLLPFPSAGI